MGFLDEELRLLYVALTRAKRSLTVCVPLAYHYAARGPWTDKHSYAQRTRFIPNDLLGLFDCQATNGGTVDDERDVATNTSVAERIRPRASSMWS